MLSVSEDRSIDGSVFDKIVEHLKSLRHFVFDCDMAGCLDGDQGDIMLVELVGSCVFFTQKPRRNLPSFTLPEAPGFAQHSHNRPSRCT